MNDILFTPIRLNEFETLIENSVRKVLNESSKNNQPESDKLLIIQEASELIKLSVPTIYSLVSRNEIPFSKRPNSKRLWFSKLDLINWIKEGRKRTITEITSDVNTNINTYVKINNKK